MEQLIDLLLNFPGGIGLLIIFLVLFACGLGLPFSEEIPILTAGYLAYVGEFSLVHAMLVCFIGVMAGDAVLFVIGNRLGLRIFRIRWIRRIMNRQRLRKSRDYFEKYGNKVVFFARFVAGLRAPVFLTAAVLRMRLLTFLAIDGLAALISVPTSVYLAFYFGAEIELLIKAITNTKEILFGLLAVAALTVILIYRLKQQKRA